MTGFKSNGVIHEHVHFIPAVTINCRPPYVAGNVDSCWVTYRPGNRPKTKEQ